MTKNSPAIVNVELLSGYLLHAMRLIYDELGEKAAGFGEFYRVRVVDTHRPISRYDELVAQYLLENFSGLRVLHVGTGIGTLDAILGCSGLPIRGVEADPHRAESARKLRHELVKTWPVVADTYEVIEGFYPEITEGSEWEREDVVLVLTNVGAGWDDRLTTRVIDTMPRFGHAIIDLERFGIRRDLADERDALFARIAKISKVSQRLDVITGYSFARFDF